MTDVYGFDKITSRELTRQLYHMRKQVDYLTAQVATPSALTSRAREAGFLTFAIPKTTLEVGGSCEAYLVQFNGTDSDSDNHNFESNTRGTVTVNDYHGWAFAVGTDDYSSSAHRLPVIQHPLSKTWTVIAPCNLIQRAKLDAEVTAGSSGTFSVYADETDTTVNVTAEVKWGDNAESVTSGKESWVRYNIEAAKWEYIGGDCE